MITAAGVVSPFGVGTKAFWDGLCEGRTAVKRISIFEPFDKHCCFAAEVKTIDWPRYLGERGWKRLDRSTRFLAIASELALKNINFNFKNADNPDMGVVIGTEWGYVESNFHFFNTIITKGPKQVNPMDFPYTIANSPASQMSLRYRLSGLNATIARGFSSGADAIGYAFHMIKTYDANKILTGATENLSIEYYTIFNKTGWLLKHPVSQKPFCRPFDSERNGIILGEGACAFVLEELKSAQKRNACIAAELLGYGFSFGNNEEALKRSMILALEDAKIKPADIEYICASANGSITKDRDEAEAIAELFEPGRLPLVSSIKAVVGECVSLTPALQIVCACMSMSKGLVTPTVNFQKGDSSSKKLNISSRPVKKKINIAMVNAFGLDGNNACLIIRKVKR